MNAQLEKLTHQDALEALLRAYRVDYDALVGPRGPAKKDAALHASRCLLELAEGVWPEFPDAAGLRSWREFLHETFGDF